MLKKSVFGFILSAAVAAPTFAASPDQVGKYIGMVKFKSYNHDTGKKTTASSDVKLEINESNLLYLNVAGIDYLPLFGNVGTKMVSHSVSFGGTSVNIVGKFSGGKQPQIKGDIRLIGPSVYQEASIKLKKVLDK